jgi:hypothetical protein
MDHHDDEEDLLIARPLTPANDKLGVLCRWIGLIGSLGLLSYAVLNLSL